MRIGVMLREIGNQEDAPGIIVRNLVDHILLEDRKNQYVLFFQADAFIKNYRSRERVEIVRVKAPTKFLWDQIAVPWVARKKKLDLLFHPKHSIPLLANTKTVMHLRGPEYWIHPKHYELLDLAYQRVFLHLFSRRATHLIAESRYARDEFRRRLSIPKHKISVVYLAPNGRFAPIEDSRVLQSCAQKYSLPARFALTVTRVVQGKKFYPGKNILKIVEAFASSEASKSMKLVIAGRRTREFVENFGARHRWPTDSLLPLDFVPQEDLPAIYNLAEFFVFPSKNESFGIPIVEAMACGCPVITSTTSACPEVAGDAAQLVDPESTAEISAAIDRLATDAGLRASLARLGIRQAGKFNWSDAASETIRILETLAAPTGLPGGEGAGGDT